MLLKEDITTLLQPIVNIDKKSVFGFGSLSRGPSDSPLHTAPMLFETAERCDQTLELETLCLRNAARHWSGHGTPLKLFVNISPAKLMPSEFDSTQLQELLLANRLEVSDIVIELSERYPTADPSELLKKLVWLRAEGFLIAIDDLGSGYSGLKLWFELKPDFDDVLGYRVGDQILLLLSELLTEVFYADDDFVGHIGGDDFVVISSSPSANYNAGIVQALLAERSRRFYRDSVLTIGYILSNRGQIYRRGR